MLEFNFNPEEKVLTCIFTGRLDTIISNQISAEMESKFRSLSESDDSNPLLDFSLIFDLEKVNFISSSFIRLCVAGKKQIREGSFCILNADPFIKKTFKIAGLDEILDVR